MSKSITRKDFLKGLGAGALTVAATGVLSACSSDSSSSEATAASTDDTTSTGNDEAVTTSESGRVFGYAGPGDWLGTAPEIADSEIAREVDCDVVVIGLGHAGVQAVLSAAENGANVYALEAMSQDMHTWYGEDIGAWNSKFQTEQVGLPEYDLGEVVDEFVTRSGGRVFPEIVRSYVHNSGATLDHMMDVAREMGVDEKVLTYDNTEDGYLIMQLNIDYDKYQETGDVYQSLRYDYPMKPGTKTWAATAQFMGEYHSEPIQGVAASSVLPLVNQACLDKAMELGASLVYGSNAQVLVQNDDGDVIGVISKEEDGYVKYNTSKGVVICGGDYAANADMCWALLNEHMERNERSGGTKDDFFSFMGGRNGSAIKMACWAGGAIEPSPRGSMLLGGGPSGPWGANSMLWLNCEGERFVNEGNISAAQTACVRQPEGTICLVTDKNYVKGIAASGLEHSGPNAGRPQYLIDLIEGMEALEAGPDGGDIIGMTVAERMSGHVIKADTLDELADYLGYEGDAKETFLASIEHYNELCDAGVDSDFGKDASAMIPVREAPFYACTTTNSDTPTPNMVTMSGLMTDKKQNVITMSRKPIKGLYAAGNSLGGRYGLGYSTPCAGNSIGMAVTHGRLAGQYVTEE